jgi:hypothetical protein
MLLVLQPIMLVFVYPACPLASPVVLQLILLVLQLILIVL